MNRTPVKSSFVKGIGHDGSTLEVEIGGRLYWVHDVKPEEAAELLAAESVGKTYNANFRHRAVLAGQVLEETEA